jgi:CheY-like chemotaxis protein/HPt (histidine-containing phosphotransfer) domain-containing protein
VLLADDDPVNREVGKIILEELGCHVDSVVSGSQALAAAEAIVYDAVFLDWHMGEMDGLGAAAAIRKLPGAHGAASLIAMTGNVSESDRAACLAAGMNDFLGKPVRLPAVQAALRRCLASLPARAEFDRAAEEPRAFGDSAIDASALSELESLAGDDNPGFLAKIVALFLEGLQGDLGLMENALLSRDSAAMYARAHDLKGSSANLGALKLASICQSLEGAAEGGRWDEVETQFSLFKEELGRVEAELGVAARRSQSYDGKRSQS